MSSRGSQVSWDVELPDKRHYSLGGRKPRGKLVVDSEAGGHEVISLPASLARKLNSKQVRSKLDPSSRAELMYEVGQLSRQVARNRVIGLANRRDYSSQEVRMKLQEDGFSSQVTHDTVEWATKAGLVSDARFADAFIRTKVYAGWGLSRIQRELARRGVNVEDVPGWPYEYLDPEDESQRAYEAAQRKTVTGANQFQKMVRFLVGRGFSMSVSIDAAHRVLDEDD